mgnify:FL=1
MVSRAKTSIYVDRNLWEKFKRYAARRGVDVSSLFEELIRDEMADYLLSEELSRLGISEDYEVDFEPVEPRGAVSELIREMRDERAGSVPG